VHEFLDARLESIVLMYHNITPPRYYEDHDPAFADLLVLGRREVERLRPRVVGAIAASSYNARELQTMGYRDIHVVPPTADVRRLANVEPRAETMHAIAAMARPIMLSVGQLMPHKRPDFLVQMMHVTESYLGMEGVLLLVGHQRLERYTNALHRQILELNLQSVRVFGAVDDHDLAAMYRSAHLMVSASEHEGFCLPLLEAMTFGLPIVARRCAAIPETVGDAALLVPQAQGPVFYADAATEALGNTALRAALVAAGERRLDELQQRPPGVAMLEALLEVV
jgi:glycosyltransferase involved in cell wall biosynthesis